jgi:thioredoxin reductase (NADPH)
MRYDLIVIGAGPAGISVAVYAASRGLQVLVLEKKKVGGIIGNVSTVTHYTAILPEETGATFAKRMEVQALSSGVEIRYEEVTEVTLEGKPKQLPQTNRSMKLPQSSLQMDQRQRNLIFPENLSLQVKASV